jgi:hypothetical protein
MLSVRVSNSNYPLHSSRIETNPATGMSLTLDEVRDIVAAFVEEVGKTANAPREMRRARAKARNIQPGEAIHLGTVTIAVDRKIILQ